MNNNMVIIASKSIILVFKFGLIISMRRMKIMSSSLGMFMGIKGLNWGNQ